MNNLYYFLGAQAKMFNKIDVLSSFDQTEL